MKSRNGDAGVSAGVRREFAKADPELPLFDIKTMSQRMQTSVRERRAGIAIPVDPRRYERVLPFSPTKRV